MSLYISSTINISSSRQWNHVQILHPQLVFFRLLFVFTHLACNLCLRGSIVGATTEFLVFVVCMGNFFLLCSCFILPPTIAASNVGWWPWPSRLFGLDISKPANLFLGDKDNNNGRMIKLVYEALSASFWRSCVSSTEPRARSYCLRVRARCSWIVISTLLLEAEYWDLFMFTKLAWNLSFLHPKSSYSDNLIRYYRLLF